MNANRIDVKNLSLITVVASCGGLLFGFDMAVISGVLPFVERQFHLSAGMQGWFVSSALIGCIIGVAFSGELCDRAGRKLLLILSAILFLVCSVGCPLSTSLYALIAFRIVGGLGVGVASIVVPLYLSEIAPANIRGRLVTYYQLAITVGIVLAYLSNAFLLHLSTSSLSSVSNSLIKWIFVDQVWRGMFGIEMIPALLFFIGLFFIPESPIWLMEKKKITGNEHQNLTEGRPKEETERGAYKELFSKKLRKPLLLGVLLPLFSQLSGINAIIYYGPSILTNAGLSQSNSLLGQVIFGLANLLFTFIAIWKVDQLGRRPLYIYGTIGASISLFATGLLFYLGFTSSFLLLFCVIVFLASFAFSIGPLKFVVASEIFPTAIRGRAMAISIMVMWVADTIVGQLTPMMLDGLGTAGTFWVFASFCAIAFVVVYYLLPETKGKTLEAIQEFWEKEENRA